MKHLAQAGLLLLMLVLWLPGCQKKYVGNIVSPEIGDDFIPPMTENRVSYENMIVDYSVTQLDEAGKYRFEGTAEMRGKAQSGVRIKSIEFRILPIKDDVIVDNIRLNVRGSDPDQPINLFKEFECKDGFDKLTFDWVVWYYH